MKSKYEIAAEATGFKFNENELGTMGVYKAMDEWAEQRARGNSAALSNLIFEATGNPDMVNKECTVGELRDAIKNYARNIMLSAEN